MPFHFGACTLPVKEQAAGYLGGGGGAGPGTRSSPRVVRVEAGG